MSRNPQARYATAQALAEDLERWLAGDPVSAWPEPLIVRARRWMKRNPTLVVSTAVTVLISLVSLATIASITGESNHKLGIKNRELDQANLKLTESNQLLADTNIKLDASNDEERRARKRAEEGEAAAERSAKEAQAVLEFFRTTVISVARPKGEGGGLGVNITVRDALDAAEPMISQSFSGQPQTEASIRMSLGDTYFDLGDRHRAVPQHERAYELRKATLGSKHKDTLTALNNFALSLRNAGKPEQALPLFEELVRLQKEALGPEHPLNLGAMLNLGSTYRDMGQLDLAIPLLKETLTLSEQHLGSKHTISTKTMRALGIVYVLNDNLEQALLLQEQALKLITAREGEKHSETLRMKYTLAATYHAAGLNDRVLPLLEEILPLMEEILGSNSSDTLLTKEQLSKIYLQARRIEEALPLVQQCVAAWRKRSEDDELLFANQLRNVAGDLYLARQYSVAEQYVRECLAIRESLIPDDWQLFNTRSFLGRVLLEQKKFEESEPLLLGGYQGLKDREAIIPENQKAELTRAIQRLVDLYVAWEKPEEAEKWRMLLPKEPVKPE